VTKQFKKSIAYLKFLNLVQALREMPAFPSIDPIEERLLNQLAAAWHLGKKVSVLEAMAMSPDASSTTVHRRLKTLKQKGIVELIADTDDSRVKYITPTKLATDYFDQLGKCLEVAAQKS
jgi:Fe2+ or Zn2+ uptake regulation protein